MKYVILDGREHRAGSTDCCHVRLTCNRPSKYGPRVRCGGRVHRQSSWGGAIDRCELCGEGWARRPNPYDGIGEAWDRLKRRLDALQLPPPTCIYLGRAPKPQPKSDALTITAAWYCMPQLSYCGAPAGTRCACAKAGHDLGDEDPRSP